MALPDAFDLAPALAPNPQSKGEMWGLISRHDWSSTLGPIQHWSSTMNTVVGTVLRSPVPMVLLWGQQGIMIYNDGYAGFAGDRHPGLLGMPVLEAWPEAADLNSRVMNTCMAGDTLEFSELELALNRNGHFERGWMDLFYSPVADENSGVVAVLAVVVEVTQRVLARRDAARVSENMSRMFQDAPSFMVQLEGPSHIVVSANKAYQRLVGGRQVVGKAIRDALPEIEGQGFFELLDDVYRTGESHVAKAAAVMLQASETGEAELRYVDFIYQPVRDENGAVSGIFVEGTDVTENVLATATIRANGERLAFLNNLADALTESRDADSILAITTRLVGKHMKVSICAYADMDDDEDGFTIRGDWSAEGSPSIVGHYSLAAFGVLAVKELKEARPLVINDNRTEIAPEEAATFQAIGISATICMPLVKEGRLTALMAIHHREPHVWTDAELQTIREVTERSWAHVERVRDEAARRDSAERLQLATTAAQIGTFDFYPKTGELRWDTRCKALFGLPPDAVVTYETFLQGLHPEDRSRVDVVVAKALDPKGSGNYDVDYRTIGIDDRTERWIAASGRVIFDAGAATRFVGTVLDISTQKALENRLRESEEQFRAMAQAMPNHVWTAKPNGELDWFNSRVYGFTGAGEGSLDGHQWATVVHPDELPAASDRWALSLATGATYETEFRLRRADGSYHWHISRAVPIKGTDGLIARWIGTNTDIQDQKETTRALADLNASLEQRVEARTQDLRTAEEALRQAQKMEAVGQLTGGIAHDFNNLLQGISGSLELLQQRVAKGQLGSLDRLLKTAADSVTRAASLTHRLLAFSRRQALAPEPTDANQLIATMKDFINQSIGPSIEVRILLASDLWPINIDPPQLESALLNLCINARDAMPDGGVLTIETSNGRVERDEAASRGCSEGEYVFLRVIDVGVGMPADVVSRVFDPFFTTKPIGKGTGLGLSMVYGFVKQSDGYVSVTSAEGEGTTICLGFPRYLGAVEDRALQQKGAQEQGAGETVLLVDDEDAIRSVVSEVLSEGGYTVLEAIDGSSALQHLRSRDRIDLLITDVGLPGGMNGRQIADAARRLRPELKVLFVTGYAENAASMATELDDDMSILAKPFTLAVLLERTNQILCKH